MLAYRLVLVDDVHASGLVLAHDLVVCPHGRSDDQVVEPVSVQVGGGHGVAEVGADLRARQVVEVRQVGIVDQDLK